MFLDRDGTLIRDTGYLSRVEDLQLLDGVVDGLRTLIDNDWLPVVLTNQSGVARGYLDEEKLRSIHRTLHERLLDRDAPVYGWFYCPHLPPDQLRESERASRQEAYLTDCGCRKPAAGLWREALETLPDAFSIRTGWSVGDRPRDVNPGLRLGGRGVLIMDDGETDPDDHADSPVVRTFEEAVERILAGA